LVALSSYDGPDGTPKELENADIDDLNIRFLNTPELCYCGHNRNRLAAATTCDVISFIDADDTMEPQRVELIAQAFEEYDIEMFRHGYRYSDDSLVEGSKKLPDDLPDDFLETNILTSDNHHKNDLPPGHNGHKSVWAEYLRNRKQDQNNTREEDTVWVNEARRDKIKEAVLPYVLSTWAVELSSAGREDEDYDKLQR
jgi:hypothetical protein